MILGGVMPETSFVGLAFVATTWHTYEAPELLTERGTCQDSRHLRYLRTPEMLGEVRRSFEQIWREIVSSSSRPSLCKSPTRCFFTPSTLVSVLFDASLVLRIVGNSVAT